jgi:hypothetical protein
MIDAERFWSRVNKTDGCWEWTGCIVNRYGQFYLNGKGVKAHRYSYIIHHPITIDLWEHREICVCHRCDNPKCVNPAHLFLGSNADNMKDKMAKGRGKQPKGEKQALSKLTETQVREIRNKYANGGITQQQLALEYGVNKSNINKLIRRKRWFHITDN